MGNDTPPPPATPPRSNPYHPGPSRRLVIASCVCPRRHEDTPAPRLLHLWAVEQGLVPPVSRMIGWTVQPGRPYDNAPHLRGPDFLRVKIAAPDLPEVPEGGFIPIVWPKIPAHVQQEYRR